MIKELNQRERCVLAGGAVVLGLLLIIFAVVLPYGTAMERLDKSIVAAKKGGRNCVFGCKRNELEAEPELIEAPSFGIDEREIEI